MIKVIRTTESYSFIGSWNRFMVSGYFAWEKRTVSEMRATPSVSKTGGVS